ncbi:MAG: tetratricopeptide repeat protein, partial [Planctomycetota bacterium]
MWRLLIVLALIAVAGPVLADERADLFRAQDLERGEGDYAAALELYRRAAEADDIAIRAEARLGAARCLRRLGKPEEARRALKTLLAGPAPERCRRAAEAELARLPGAETDPAPPPDPPPDPDAKAEQEAKLRLELANWFVNQAKAFLGEARFDDARDRLTRALALDPGHEEARALFDRLGDTPGGRERLVREVLRLLDYERELRRAELAAELDARIAAGEAALRIGDLDGAVLRFHRASRLIDASPGFAGDLAGRRTKIEELRQRAVTRGGKLPDPLPPEEDAPPTPAWRTALRELLIEMASAPPGTQRLRVHEVALPPGPPAAVAGSRPFAREGRPVIALDLLARVLSRHPAAGPWTFVRPFGDALVAGGPPEFQETVDGELARISSRQDRPIRIRALAVTMTPANLSLVHGVVDFLPATGPTRSGVIVNPEQAERFVARLLSPEIGDVVAQADLTLLPGASVTLSRVLALNLPDAAKKIEYGLRLALLAHRERDGALRVAIDGSCDRIGRMLALPVLGRTLSVPEFARTAFSAVGTVPEGGAWFEAGLANPFESDGDGSRDTLLLIFRTLPPGNGETGSTEPPPAAGPVPVDLLGLDARPA